MHLVGMAARRSTVLAVLLGVLVLSFGPVVQGDEGVHPGKAEETTAKLALVKELENLKSQLSHLESGLKEKESTLEEKDKKISDLRTELDHLHTHKNGAGEAESQLESALAKVSQLESEVTNLKAESEQLKLEVRSLTSRAERAESSSTQHLFEKDKAVTSLSELKTRLQKVERALRIAEAAMTNAESEAAEKAQELAKVSDAWLPPWVSTHVATLHSTASSHWSTHGEPVVSGLKRSASAQAAMAQEWAKPHLETLNTKGNPVIRERWEKIAIAVAPYFERIKKAGPQYVDATKEYVTPYLEKAQKSLEPYVQVLREKSRPYVDRAAVSLAPHFERVNTLTEPYLEKVNLHYRRVLTSATGYHENLQISIKGTLGKHEALALLATKELAWFLASALLALPVVALLLVFSSAFGGKKSTSKRGRTGHLNSNHSSNKKPRRAKQVDK